MKITRLELRVSEKTGLGPSTLAPLGDLVVLAGPNGSGKSRILRLVKTILSDHNLAPSAIDGIRGALAQHEAGLQAGKGVYPQQSIEVWKHIVERRDSVEFDDQFATNAVLEFVPTQYELADHRSMAESGQLQAVNQVRGLGLGNLNRNVLAYLASVERRWFAATHQALPVDESAKNEAIDERTRLADLVRDLLGESPMLNLDLQPTLFGFPVPDAQLSHGQSVLLQLAVALHAQGPKLDGLVLLLDEPECHLHPSAVIDIIQRLRSFNKLGQIWVATHSVSILAALPTECVWYVSDGKVSWAGRRPEKVLEGLLGGPAGREQMEEYLRLPAQFASNRFAAECLTVPSRVTTAADDPQAKQLRDFCQIEVRAKSNSLKVLDFGAGEGRLLSAMYECWEPPDSFCSIVDYRAYEPFVESPAQLDAVVHSVYGAETRSRIYRKREQLRTIDESSLDVIAMCNVLHEIPPEEWKLLFGKEGIITRLLAPTGNLLILEDMEIPHGEKAHRFGFLLLDHCHLHKLMGCAEADPATIQTVSARAGRLKAHAVPAILLGRTDRATTLDALKLLKETARDEIAELRRQAPDSRNGRLHALWTQLFANADFGRHALE